MKGSVVKKEATFGCALFRVIGFVVDVAEDVLGGREGALVGKLGGCFGFLAGSLVDFLGPGFVEDTKN